jgi:iron complex outermembrane receptor protein
LDLPNWSSTVQPNSDEETYAQLNAEFELDLGVITSVKTGFAWADHEVEKSLTSRVPSSRMVPSGANMYKDSQRELAQGYKVPDADFKAMLNRIKAAGVAFDSYENLSGYGNIEEENLSLYLMANFEGEGFRGNVGFRYISTEAQSDYYAFDGVTVPNALPENAGFQGTLSTAKESYDDILPSINVAFDLSDDVILRTSVSQAISRPNYSQMFSAQSMSGFGNADATDNTLTAGNIGLLPTKASMADLGIEWYYGDSSMMSATYFLKDVTSFTTSSSTAGNSIGIVDPVDGGDNWTFTSFDNASGGEIRGVELQLQHDFDNGFGGVINYTYADASAPKENYEDLNGAFTNSSQDTVNLVGYWESDVFSARAAYNWRSAYMIRESGFYGARQHEDYGTLDLSFGWNITDNLALSLEAVNVLEEDSIQTGVAPARSTVKNDLKEGFPAFSFDGEARYKLGVSYNF